MEYRLEDIFENSYLNPMGGYNSDLQVGQYVVEICGGDERQFGDFKKTFQLAVFDKKGNNVTKEVVPSAKENVLKWVDTEEIIEIINAIPH